MKVLPQDQGDFLRLKAFLESVSTPDGTQSRARAELLAKLRSYELDAGPPEAALHAAGGTRTSAGPGEPGSRGPGASGGSVARVS